ncbi:MAG: sigma-54 dependent transcriptional regulator [Spirochaetaceae bacterium]|nr:sigma-54 dependent transcriptional regulator [Spirochaetaceae bacterium]
MTSSAAFRKPPQPGNLPTLFEIQRILTFYSDIGMALPSCARQLSKALPPCEVLISLSLESGKAFDQATILPETSRGKYKNLAMEMGKAPFGLAVENEALSLGQIEADRLRLVGGQQPQEALFVIEAPIFSSSPKGDADRKISGALCVILDATPSDEQRHRAADLVQWSCYLIEEASSLRDSLAGQRLAEQQAGSDPDGWLGQKSQRSRTIPTPGPDLASRSIAFHGIIGASDRMKEVYTLIEQVAGTSATVLITGESGTGKELAAKAIHECSKRSGGPFVAVNCSALPEGVIESELFGHEKGAFTGAIAARQGRFEAARDGSLFLDEIGDLSPAVQIKLLRILQERSFERVGDNKIIKTNARIIAATNRDLAGAVKQGKFREDLYFRLNVFPIHMPPLRERGADILLLADYFVEKSSATLGKTIKRISSPALDLLMIYHWPGNVRELENCIERAVIVSNDNVIHAYNLPPSLQSAMSTGTEPSSTLDGSMARLEKEMLVEALKIERGNSARAARRLGISERRFRLALDRYKIDYRMYRDSKAFRTRM